MGAEQPGRPAATVYLGLGTNLGDRRANLRAALERMEPFLDLVALSSVWRSDPVGGPEQPEFWNMVVRGRTDLGPEALLRRLQEVEDALGRERPYPNAPRTMDVDLLLYEARTMDTPLLTVPHPRITERAFVLGPLAEIAPDLRHPETGERLADRYRRRGDTLGAAEPVIPADALRERR